MASLPIRQQLNRLPGLRAEPKALLIEVCELIENGGRNLCWATNSALAERMGKPAKSISRLLMGLEHGGWLTVKHLPEQGNRREIRPTTKCRAAYDPSVQSEDTQPEVRILTSESEDTHLAEVRIPISEDTLSLEVGIPIPRSEDRVSPEVRRLDYDHTTPIEEKKIEVVVSSESEDTTTTFLSKISELEEKLVRAREWARKKQARIKELEQEVADLRNGAIASVVSTQQITARATPPDEAPIFLRADFFAYLDSLEDAFGKLDRGYYLMTIQSLAEDSTPKERTNDKWQKFIRTCLSNDKRDGKLMPAKPKPGEQPRPAYGAAPTIAAQPGDSYDLKKLAITNLIPTD